MARKDDVLGVNGAQTVIGSGVTVKGDLIGEGDIIVDGTMSGRIKAVGDVTIGVNGVVTASISGTNITVAGSVTGNIRAEGELTIRESGQVIGDIIVGSLAIVSGGSFVGHSSLSSKPEQSE